MTVSTFSPSPFNHDKSYLYLHSEADNLFLYPLYFQNQGVSIMKTSPDERSYNGGGWDAETLVLPYQSWRRRSLLRLPEFHLNSDSKYSSNDINPKSPTITKTQNQGTPTSRFIKTQINNIRQGSNISNHHNNPDHWDGPKQQKQNPHRPPRPSLQLQLQSPEFADQFDAFLYQSQHIATPSYAPEVMLEIPSEESSRRPSNCSGISSLSPFVPNNQPPANFLPPNPTRHYTGVIPMQATLVFPSKSNMCLQQSSILTVVQTNELCHLWENGDQQGALLQVEKQQH
jgi:hypothetical protein